MPADRTAALRLLDVRDAVSGGVVPVAVVHPGAAPERAHRVGPYELSVAPDAAPTGDDLPLVVISHGNTGSPWTHRHLATHLARAGFVVALPEHVGNSWRDASSTDTVANLVDRPRHVRLAIDAVLADPVVGPRTHAVGVGVIGHSIGAYTALAVAGGRPAALPHETNDGIAAPVEVDADPRVEALVLLAPACPWFAAEGSLADVRARILLRAGEHDAITPPAHGQIIARGLRADVPIDHRVVAGAGHFSFQDPFPATLRRPGFPPAHDPPGFDRAAYQRTLRAEVAEFLDGRR